MSAIAGVYYFDQKPVSYGLLEQMNQVMAHRSPDDQGLWAEHCVGLAHGMLWSTPESLCEKLPLKRSAFVLTSDARIDNREELAAIFGFAPGDLSKIPDSEFILAAYDQWGEDCPIYLLGDFAFAIWDQSKQQLFCARDPMGVKPFVYTRSQWGFAFASEIKALFCLPEVSRQVNEFRIGQLLMRQLDDRELTLYEQVRRLPAAHHLTIAPGLFRLHKYWQLDPQRELKLSSDYEYAEAYREAFEKAVRSRLRTAFPIGSMLSGGMDSSSIACMAREHLSDTHQSTLHTFSMRFESLPEAQKALIDETFYVQSVLDKGSFTPHFIDGDQLNPLAHTEEMFAQIDELFFGPNLYYNWAWYDRARSNQVRVVLDGIDGDSTISHGYPYLYELINQRRFLEFGREIRALSRLMGRPILPLIWTWGIQELIPRPVHQWIQQWQAQRKPLWSKTGLHPNFARENKLAAYQLQWLKQQFSIPPLITARDSHCYSLDSGLIQYALELADRTAAAFQVELRYPFCDRRLMEFCVSLPPEQKYSRGVARLIARRGLDGILPDAIRHRLTKANLGANTKPQLLHLEQSRIEQYVLNLDSLVFRYFDPQELQAAYQRYQRDPLNEQDALAVYAATQLGLWFDRPAISCPNPPSLVS